MAPCLQAQDAYPSKPVTMIAPFPPGGVADIVGRPLAASMEKTLKQPVLVVNRSGAGGAVGTTAAAKAAPDGYTILMSLSSISIFPVSDPINGRPAPYQLVGLRADRAGHVRSDGARGRAPTVPTRRSRISSLRRRPIPDKMNYSSSGVYGTLHVAMEMFANSAGIRLFHVPYQGGGPAVAALLGGQVACACFRPRRGDRRRSRAARCARSRAGATSACAVPRAADLQGAGLQGRRVLHLVGRVRARGHAGAGAGAAARRGARRGRRPACSGARWKRCRRRSATWMRPQFRDFLARDAARLKIAVEKIGKVDQK